MVWVPFVGLCWVTWPELRCWGFRNNLVWLDSWKMWWNLVYVGYPLSVIRGLVRSMPCSRFTQIGRKTVRTWISLCGNRMVLHYEMDPKQKPLPRRERAHRHRHRSGGRRESGNRRGSSVGKSTPRSSSRSRRRRGGRMWRARAARKFLEKFDPQYQQLKEEAKTRERTVELQEQAEVFAKVMKEHFIKPFTPP